MCVFRLYIPAASIEVKADFRLLSQVAGELTESHNAGDADEWIRDQPTHDSTFFFVCALLCARVAKLYF